MGAIVILRNVIRNQHPMATHHIDTITSLLEQLDTIRYQEPVATSYPLGESSRLNSVHSLFRAFADNLKLAETQDALRAARTSEISDAKEIIWDDEDERVLIGKRRRSAFVLSDLLHLF